MFVCWSGALYGRGLIDLWLIILPLSTVNTPPLQPTIPPFMQGAAHIRARFFLMVEHLLAELKGCCGVCWVVQRRRVPREEHGGDTEWLNNCPAARRVREAFNLRMEALGRPLFSGSLCFIDAGPHNGGDQCPIRIAERAGELNRAEKLCSHCWLGEDGDLGFHQDKRWGGKSCSTAHPGREFVREAVFALYHARPDYVARAMDGVKKWDMLPKAANHYCACVDAAAEVPVQMPSLAHFASWAGARWLRKIKASNGVVLLVHYHRLTHEGTVDLRGPDLEFWKLLEHTDQLERYY